MKVLTNHNNLKYFMGMTSLNKRQARWAIKLSMFDFFITHRSGKTNLVDASSRRPDYKDENESLNRLLSTLQQKLTAIEDLISLIFAVIRTAYGQDKSYEHTERSSNVGPPFAIHSLDVNA